MRLGTLSTIAAGLGCGLLLATCGGGGGSKTADTGHDSADVYVPECLSSFDCVEGDCKDDKCVRCTSDPCPAGEVCTAYTCPAGHVCNAEFKCVTCPSGGCTGGDASVSACTTRADCPADQICKSKKCQAPAADGTCLTNDECIAGQVCNFNATPSTCMVGCFSNADCQGVTLDGGLPAPHCDTQITNQCGPCVDGNDCAVGEVCKDQRCQVAPECVPPDRTPCGDRACMPTDGGYACGPCLLKDDCGAGYDCIGGKCVAVSSGCTDDSQCKTISPGHWCDTTTGQCEWGCMPVPNDGGTCAPNCCSGSEICNPATHQCGNYACTDCNPACGFGEVCDTSTCSCRGANERDGGTVIPCNKDDCTGCPAGMSCYCGASALGQEYQCTAALDCNPGMFEIEAYCK